METAKQLLHASGSRSPRRDDLGNLRGLITIKDIEKQTPHRTRTRDLMGGCAGAAVGVTRTRSSAPTR
jgi:hypothetical protein